MTGKWVASIVVSLYRHVLRPLLGGGGNCRYTPSCSEYAVDAIGEFGVVRGAWLALRRFASCRPRGGMGWDPVKHTSQQAVAQAGAETPF